MDMPYLLGIQFSGLLTLGSGARTDIGDAPRFGGVQDSTYFAGGFAPPQYNFLFLGGWAYRRVDVRFRKDFRLDLPLRRVRPTDPAPPMGATGAPGDRIDATTVQQALRSSGSSTRGQRLTRSHH